ncbi:hypothetical protein I0P70_13625 [Pontibacter sp. FD36]|uniref:hypothetical protein n=1 Tax=Pontibacter sp. FD36 TaxID=2789860 RepID=UPI0018AC517B|nr:hypothetical protein [Pontibacter sp. FD36]MBF8964289.1 hypothetical protein [Pontibacter sp. FD36]
MPIQHKFFQENWENEFETNSAILDVTPYEPEVMFIGTFNPDTPHNVADFFYGRNYFWTGFENLFTHNAPLVQQRRDWLNPLSPSIIEVLELCRRQKLTFADLILEVLHNDNPHYEYVPNNKIDYQNNVISLIEDNGLQQLDDAGQVHWNTGNIINYLCDHPNIKTIYFTRRPNGIWQEKWNAIANHRCMESRTLINIYTPSGRRLSNPVMSNLQHRWVHNDVQGFGRLDNAWLQANGVNLNNF